MKNENLYAAFKAKDTRFDGRFFVGIKSTGIYCRPVCRAKQAHAKNCTFYPTAAAAERAGFRPCLLCRPELAPGLATTDASASLSRRAAKLLEENCGSGQSLEVLAGQLGCTGRHLRRVFASEYQVSPVQYLQTCRLLLAKSLLTDTNLSVLDVALAAGFGSLRRFNDLFRAHYHLSPTALRKKAPEARVQCNSITLFLGYRPPYPFSEVLRFLSGRLISGVELIRDEAYWRTVRLSDVRGRPVSGWLCVHHSPQKNALRVTLGETLLPILPQVLARVRHLFDLSCDPDAVFETLAEMNTLRLGLCVPGTRLPGCFDTFEMATRAVLGQQITVKAAGTLAGRLVAAYGTPVQTGIPELTHTFPTPQDILTLDGSIESHLGPLGIIAARARAIFKLAEALESGQLDLAHCADPEAEMEKLLLLPGIGRWTASYIAMRAMGWPDAFPETDVAIKKALSPRTPKEMLALSEAWRPWRSYATINLWNSL